MTTCILLGCLLGLPTLAVDDTDPEPPRPNKGIVAKLVAKQTTFKLDLKGHKTAREFADAVAAGKVAALPVDLELVITNHTNNDIRVRTQGAVPKLTLTLKGPGVAATSPEKSTPGRVTYVVLKPGQKVSIPLPTLTSFPQGMLRSLTHHFWTEPGEYTLSASFETSIDNNDGKAKRPYPTLAAPAIKIKVEK